MAKVLITGGAGFIGSSIAEKLIASGESIRIIDDFSSGRRENLESLRGHFDLYEGSVADAALVKRAIQGVEVVFHEAAIPSVARSVEDPVSTMQAGTQATTVLLDAAKNAGVRRFVYAASSAAYGDTPVLPKVETMAPAPLSPYAVSKLAGEHLLRVFAGLYGIETVSLRYFNVFGPRQDPASDYAAVIPKFMSMVANGKRPIIFGDGEQTRDFCYIDNVVSANILAATTTRKLSGEVVNIACHERTSLNQLIKLIGDIAVEEGAVTRDGILAPEYRAVRAGDVRDSLADISAAKALLGYAPVVDIREGLRRTFAVFRKPQ